MLRIEKEFRPPSIMLSITNVQGRAFVFPAAGFAGKFVWDAGRLPKRMSADSQLAIFVKDSQRLIQALSSLIPAFSQTHASGTLVVMKRAVLIKLARVLLSMRGWNLQ
jgi:hypothetical protein